jgi:hypothetical protein
MQGQVGVMNKNEILAMNLRDSGDVIMIQFMITDVRSAHHATVINTCS